MPESKERKFANVQGNTHDKSSKKADIKPNTVSQKARALSPHKPSASSTNAVVNSANRAQRRVYVIEGEEDPEKAHKHPIDDVNVTDNVETIPNSALVSCVNESLTQSRFPKDTVSETIAVVDSDSIGINSFEIHNLHDADKEHISDNLMAT